TRIGGSDCPIMARAAPWIRDMSSPHPTPAFCFAVERRSPSGLSPSFAASHFRGAATGRLSLRDRQRLQQAVRADRSLFDGGCLLAPRSRTPRSCMPEEGPDPSGSLTVAPAFDTGFPWATCTWPPRIANAHFGTALPRCYPGFHFRVPTGL